MGILFVNRDHRLTASPALRTKKFRDHIWSKFDANFTKINYRSYWIFESIGFPSEKVFSKHKKRFLILIKLKLKRYFAKFVFTLGISSSFDLVQINVFLCSLDFSNLPRFLLHFATKGSLMLVLSRFRPHFSQTFQEIRNLAMKILNIIFLLPESFCTNCPFGSFKLKAMSPASFIKSKHSLFIICVIN